MISKVSIFKTKRLFLDYFKKNDYIKNDKVGFRMYNPNQDAIHQNFTIEDWDMVFYDVDELLLKDWAASYNIDRMLLMAVDMKSGMSFGFICIQELHNKPFSVCFHGGVWNHGIKEQLLGFEAADLILRFLVDNRMDVFVTCYRWNTKANRFLNSLGFVDYCYDERLCYKKLDVERLNSNILCKRNSSKSMAYVGN